jgi:hypothetical protein
MSDIGAASGDNSVTGPYYFPDVVVYDLSAAESGVFNNINEG